jgi:hypothetical protein
MKSDRLLILSAVSFTELMVLPSITDGKKSLKSLTLQNSKRRNSDPLGPKLLTELTEV